MDLVLNNICHKPQQTNQTSWLGQENTPTASLQMNPFVEMYSTALADWVTST